MTDRGIRDAGFADLDGRKIFAERAPGVPEPVVADEEAVRKSVRAAVVLQRIGVQPVVDGVTRLVEWQTRFAGTASRVGEAEHERVRAEVACGVEIVVAKAEVLARVDVPVQLCNQLVVVGVEEVPLVWTRVVVVSADHSLPNSVHYLCLDARYPQSRCSAATGNEVRAGIFRSLDLTIHIIEELVLEQRAADGNAALVVGEVGIGDDL